jgi:replication factor C subunit 3/5
MSLWCDKQRPRSLDKLDYHLALTDRLHKIAEAQDLPHLLFYGPPGAGKKTRISCLLKAIFGPGVEKTKVEKKSFKATSSKTVEITALGSNFHLEMNPSDVGMYDRVVVQEIIKEIAAAQNLATADASTSRPFKVVVLTEADQLTKQAQHGLRRTMEKFAATCRIILCCESLSKIIEPVRSRCLAIRVPAPTTSEISQALTKVCKSEGVSLSPVFASNISQHSKRNLRRALLMAEASRVQAGPNSTLSDETPIQIPDWERYIAQVAKEITSSQTPQVLLDTRAKLYELLANCIPAEVILKSLVNELNRKLDDDLKFQVIHWAAFYQARLVSQGQKAIYHLEAFIAKFLAIYKEYLVSMFS